MNSEDHKTDPSELRYPTVPPALPLGVYAVPSEALQHLIDGQLAIHEEIRTLKLASKNPPPWAEKWLEEFSERISKLEEDVQNIKITCASKHSNGHQKLTLI